MSPFLCTEGRHKNEKVTPKHVVLSVCEREGEGGGCGASHPTHPPRERMHPEIFSRDQIQNGCLSAIIYFHMPDIW